MPAKTKASPVGRVVKTFVDLVSEALEEQGMSRAELAQRANVGMPYLYRVLNGQQVPSFDWAEKVGRVLGISICFEKTTQ